MLVLPGQGVLTIIAGMMLLDFPGRQRLERWLVQRPAVLRSINWRRKRNNRPLLVAGERGHAAAPCRHLCAPLPSPLGTFGVAVASFAQPFGGSLPHARSGTS